MRSWAMPKTCWLSAAVLVPILLGYSFLIEGPPGQRAVATLLVGVGTWLGVMTLLSMRFALRESRAVRRALAGAEPRDGAWTAAIGPLLADGEPLRSPFAGEACCVYEYQIGRFGGTSGRMLKVERRGYVMAASRVETARGPIRLLGFPDLDAVPADVPSSPEARERARQFVESTAFELTPLADSTRMLRELYCSREPTTLLHWKDSNRGIDLGELDLLERRVKAGARVCVLGRYSEAERALVAEYDRGDLMQVRDPDEVSAASALKWSLAWRAVAGLVLIGGCNAVFAWSRASADSAREWAREVEQQAALAEALRLGSIETVRELATRERIADWEEDRRGALLTLATDPASVRLLAERGTRLDVRDADGETALHRAVDRSQLELATALVEAGADVSSERSSDGETPLWTALDGWRPELVRLLLEAGAEDDRVTASDGTALPEDGGAALELCRRYVEAIHATDGEALRALSSQAHQGQWSQFEPEQTSRVPERVDEFRGFETRDRATVRVVGPGASGSRRVMTFQLVAVDGDWRVHRAAGELQPLPGG